ncbi:metalloprotease [Mycoemilia scoparia]|uniref:Metalloprotease n=1 Tax=Mycoemilia scoparia TaxID=417184 RepID=A0A9W8DN05_9FUNG|nr:metalloprotease [Mycoemilia scoparia]
MASKPVVVVDNIAKNEVHNGHDGVDGGHVSVTCNLTETNGNCGSSSTLPTIEGYSLETTIESKLPYYQYTSAPIEHPVKDDRKYRYIRLPNNMEALLIQGHDDEMAMAAMDVSVGSLMDPKEYPGLAHFCEHLLFMGTEKYPEENNYSNFISNNGGNSNAFTDTTNTCYYFEISHRSFEPALDRFSQFFISPRFDASCTEREVKAVDSEYKKNTQNDSWRYYHILKTLSNSKYPFSQFNIGNYESLMGAAGYSADKMRSTVIDFYQKYYTSDLMKLIVVGNESLDQLAEWVVSKFSAVKSKGITSPEFTDPPFTSSELGKFTYFNTVRKSRCINICFPMPQLLDDYESLSMEYLSSIICSESVGTPSHYLKKKGWLLELAMYPLQFNEYFSIHCLCIELTETGIKHYKEIIELFFGYFELLREEGINEEYYKQFHTLRNLNFVFSQKKKVNRLVMPTFDTMRNMHIPRHKLFYSHDCPTRFNPHAIVRCLDMLNPDNCRIVVGTDEPIVDRPLKEKLFDIDYQEVAFDEELLKRFREAVVPKEIKLPDPNKFLPESLECCPKDPNSDSKLEPKLLFKDTQMELWFRQDDRFHLPRSSVCVDFVAPHLYADKAKLCLTGLVIDMVAEQLAPEDYDAEEAGLSFDIGVSHHGFFLIIDGYSDKIVLLCQTVLKALRNFEFDQTRFEMLHKRRIEALSNKAHQEPVYHVQGNFNFLKQKPSYHYTELLEVITEITEEDVKSHILTMFDELYTKIEVLGNYETTHAVEIATAVSKVMRLPQPPSVDNPPGNLTTSPFITRGVGYPSGHHVHRTQTPSANNVNSAANMFMFGGSFKNIEERVCMSFLGQIIHESSFNQLRTIETLGYIVFAVTLNIRMHQLGIGIVVQSECDPIYLNLRIDTFFSTIHQKLVDMPDDEFKSNVDSMINTREAKDKNISQEATRYWNQISNGHYQFDTLELEVTALKNLKKETIIEFWNKYFNEDTAGNSRIIFNNNIYSQKIPYPTSEELVLFPATTHAIRGSVYRLGSVDIGLEPVQKIIDDAVGKIDASNKPTESDINNVFEQIKSIYEQKATEATLSKKVEHDATISPDSNNHGDKTTTNPEDESGKVKDNEGSMESVLKNMQQADSVVKIAISMALERSLKFKSKSPATVEEGDATSKLQENAGSKQLSTPEGIIYYDSLQEMRSVGKLFDPIQPSRPLDPIYKVETLSQLASKMSI